MPNVEDTWASRDLPLLVAAYHRYEADVNRPGSIHQLEELRQQVGYGADDFVAGLTALANADPPFLAVETASGWTHEKAGGGYIVGVSERARRELGAWPTPESVVEQLVAALLKQAETESEPEHRSRLETAAAVLGGMARDIAVNVVSARLGTLA